MKFIFLSKKHEVGGVYSFVFRPAEPVRWIAGQSVRLEIGGHERRFSIVSAPYEQHIAITTRLSGSGFKQALDKLKPGMEIDGFNIEGTFVWQALPRQKVLLASGIGITPYISMFRQLHHDQQSINALLVYANRDDRFVFGDELRQLQHAHPELTIKFLPDTRLSQSIIETYIPNPTQSLVYLSGPEAMVTDMTPLLLKIGVNDPDLKRDIFTGRPDWHS